MLGSLVWGQKLGRSPWFAWEHIDSIQFSWFSAYLFFLWCVCAFCCKSSNFCLLSMSAKIFKIHLWYGSHIWTPEKPFEKVEPMIWISNSRGPWRGDRILVTCDMRSNWCSRFPLLQIKLRAMKSCRIERVLNNLLTSHVMFFPWKNVATANYLDTMVKQSSLNVIVFEVDQSVETPEIQMGKMGVLLTLRPLQWTKPISNGKRFYLTQVLDKEHSPLDQLGKPEMDRNRSFPRLAFENNSLASAVPSGKRIKSYMILRLKPDCKIWTSCPTKPSLKLERFCPPTWSCPVKDHVQL